MSTDDGRSIKLLRKWKKTWGEIVRRASLSIATPKITSGGFYIGHSEFPNEDIQNLTIKESIMIRRLASIASLGFVRLNIDIISQSARLLTRIFVSSLIMTLLFPMVSSYSRADQLILSVDPSTQTIEAGQSGSIELFLSNPSTNTTTFNVGGFSVELSLPNNGAWYFTSGSLNVPNYIYQYNSLDELVHDSIIGAANTPNGNIPASTVVIGDEAVPNPITGLNGYTALAPGQSYSLGSLGFSVASNVMSGVYNIAIPPFSEGNQDPTSFEELSPNGAQYYDYSVNGATITVDGKVSVPEPSSITLALLGISGSISVKTIRDRKKAIS